MSSLEETIIYLLSSGVGLLLIISSCFTEELGKSFAKTTKIFGAMLFILGLVLLVLKIYYELLMIIFR